MLWVVCVCAGVRACARVCEGEVRRRARRCAPPFVEGGPHARRDEVTLAAVAEALNENLSLTLCCSRHRLGERSEPRHLKDAVVWWGVRQYVITESPNDTVGKTMPHRKKSTVGQTTATAVLAWGTSFASSIRISATEPGGGGGGGTQPGSGASASASAASAATASSLASAKAAAACARSAATVAWSTWRVFTAHGRPQTRTHLEH